MTKDAALALKNAQAEFKKRGYCIVVYDSYRSQESVDNFMRWSKDINDQCKKDEYYPRVDKAKVFELGYVAARSGHSRGSTIDMTIIKDGQELHEIKVSERKLKDGFTVKYLDDGTEDMGTSFDLFDEASHTDSKLIKRKCREKTKFFKSVLEKCNFANYDQEWWHYTLKNEPFAKDQDKSYHGFSVE
jgi:D-alanyl-D-alanine dipeptidase